MYNYENGALRRITELKRTLLGREKRFDCAVLRHNGSHIVVLFVATEAMHVHGIDLPAGTVTFGHFWTDRPYNVYHWLNPESGATMDHYVNLSADTRLSEGLLEWLDLIVDILIVPGHPPAILDEDEVPADADSALRGRIAEATEAVLRHPERWLAELERDRSVLWPSISRVVAAQR